VQHEVEDFYYGDALHMEARHNDIERVKVLLQANKHEINKLYASNRFRILDFAILNKH